MSLSRRPQQSENRWEGCLSKEIHETTLGVYLRRLRGGTAAGRNEGSDASHNLARWEQPWEISGRIRKEIERSADRKSRPRD